jgi:hypothetical protein
MQIRPSVSMLGAVRSGFHRGCESVTIHLLLSFDAAKVCDNLGRLHRDARGHLVWGKAAQIPVNDGTASIFGTHFAIRQQ